MLVKSLFHTAYKNKAWLCIQLIRMTFFIIVHITCCDVTRCESLCVTVSRGNNVCFFLKLHFKTLSFYCLVSRQRTFQMSDQYFPPEYNLKNQLPLQGSMKYSSPPCVSSSCYSTKFLTKRHKRCNQCVQYSYISQLRLAFLLLQHQTWMRKYSLRHDGKTWKYRAHRSKYFKRFFTSRAITPSD